MKRTAIFLIISLLFTACHREQEADAYGNFFTRDVIIQSQTQGKVLKVMVNQGDKVRKGDTLAIIDHTILQLKRKQLIAQKKAISSQSANIIAQVRALEEQKAVLDRTLKRLKRLLQDSAVSQQKVDETEGQVRVLREKINAIKTQNAQIFAQLEALDMQIKELDQQISWSFITSPQDATVLERYINPGELALPGTQLFKIANIDTLELVAYITEPQLAQIKLGQKVKVLVDSAGQLSTYYGKISFVSDQAEFTPKTIETRDDRVNLVYQIKILVPNTGGSLKIGMPAEVIFSSH